MARISSYAKDKIPELGDKVIGSDGSNSLETLNYTLREIGELFNLKNVVGVADQSIFLFQSDLQAGRNAGTISFASGGGVGATFSSITTFMLSKSASGLGDRSQFLPLFLNKDIILAELGTINNFGTYKVTSIEESVTEPDFFVVTVANTHSNGSIVLDKSYIFSEFANPDSDAGDLHFVFTQGISSLTWEVEHNLNKFPSITVIDTGNTVVVGQYKYIDNNNVTLTFSAAFAGKAYLN
jgi:hypothetical protein